MKKSTVHIVRELVSLMNFPFTIKSVTDHMNGTYTLTTGSTHYLQKGSNNAFIINGNQYEILEVVINQSVKVKGSVLPPSPFSFNLPVPYFFHGTIRQTNTELSEELDMAKKTPMVYLLRPFSEEVDAQDLNDTLVEREPSLTLFFLTEADFTNWITEDFDHEAVEPMWSMLNTFIDTAKSSGMIGKIDRFRIEDKIKFANYTANGAEKILFKDNLSGKQLDITLPIYATCCDTDC